MFEDLREISVLNLYEERKLYYLRKKRRTLYEIFFVFFLMALECFLWKFNLLILDKGRKSYSSIFDS